LIALDENQVPDGSIDIDKYFKAEFFPKLMMTGTDVVQPVFFITEHSN